MITHLALVTALLGAPPQEDARRPLEPMDLFELEGVANPNVAPDGSAVLYARVGFDVMKDRRVQELWIHDVEKGINRPLIEGVGRAAWAPDGDRIAYVMDAGEGSGAEIHLRWMDDGATRQLTRLPKGPSSLSWSPDGTRIAFTMKVDREREPLARMPSPPKGAEWADAPKVIERFKYRGDGQGYLDDADTQIFVVSADGGTARQLTSAPADHGGPLVWKDGDTLLFSANLRPDRNDHPSDSDIHALDVATGELTQITDRYGPDRSPAYDRESGRLYWLGHDDTRQGHSQTEAWMLLLENKGIVFANEDEAPVELSTGLDHSVVDLVVDGDTVWLSHDARGQRRALAIGFGGVKPPTGPLAGMGAGRPYTSGSFHAAGGTSAWVGHGPGGAARDDRAAWPGELWVQTIGRVASRVTGVNDDLRETLRLGELVEVNATSSADGRAIQGWMIMPPGPQPDGAKPPLILEIHGGPFAAYGPNFSFELQLMAARGYAVLYGNPRGSTSYGEEFANLIHHAYPGDDYHDLMALVDRGVELANADPERLYVTGGSGGGVLTAWIVGTTDRFAAAVVAKPVINWTSFVLTADSYAYFWQYWFPTAPWNSPMGYWERSPLSRVGNVSTPTMLLTGESDYRTPISESEQFYQALKIRGVETAFVRIPGAGHGIAARPSHLIGKVLHILGWFERAR